MATVEKWECRKCGWVYKSPTVIKDISHPCPKKHKKRVWLHKIEEGDGED